MGSPGGSPYLLSCLCSRSRRDSSSERCWRFSPRRGALARGGEGRLHRGTSWYWGLVRVSPQKLKMLDTPENAPGGGRGEKEGDDSNFGQIVQTNLTLLSSCC